MLSVLGLHPLTVLVTIGVENGVGGLVQSESMTSGALGRNEITCVAFLPAVEFLISVMLRDSPVELCDGISAVSSLQCGAYLLDRVLVFGPDDDFLAIGDRVNHILQSIDTL